MVFDTNTKRHSINISRKRKRRITRSNLWRNGAKAIFERGYSTPSAGILAFFRRMLRGCTLGSPVLCITRRESHFRFEENRRTCKQTRTISPESMISRKWLRIQARELTGTRRLLAITIAAVVISFVEILNIALHKKFFNDKLFYDITK